jgi:hypothetical protein
MEKYPEKFNDVYSGDKIAQSLSKGVWICGTNITSMTVLRLTITVARFIFIMIAVRLSIESDTEINKAETVSKSFRIQTEIVILSIFLMTYLMLYSSNKFFSIRKKRLNGLIRMSGFLDFMNTKYEF